MARKHRLDAVATLARHRQLLAEKALADAERTAQTLRETQSSLAAFRQDYEQPDHLTRSGSLSAMTLQDRQRFTDRLGDGIRQVQEDLVRAEAVIRELRHNLQQATTRAESIDLVITRAHQLQREHADATEQRMLDELATLAGSRRT